MTENRPTRGWVLPVLLAVTTAAGGLAFLYLTRPNPGELGAVRVVVAEDGKADAGALHVYVAEAPLVQKEVVSPGRQWTGVVHYPAPYRLPPNLKLTSAARRYQVVAETETGFGWVAQAALDDLAEEVRKAPDAGQLIDRPLEFLDRGSKLRPGIVFEDFTWEAKGLRAPVSTLPPRTFEQKGTFYTIVQQESVVPFPVPYATPPNVELSGVRSYVVVVEVTPTQFRWRNVAKERFGNEGDVQWTARGVLGPAGEPKK